MRKADNLPPSGSAQPLTEMSTRSISWGKTRPMRKADNLPPSCCRCHEIWEPFPGTLWDCPGLISLYYAEILVNTAERSDWNCVNKRDRRTETGQSNKIFFIVFIRILFNFEGRPYRHIPSELQCHIRVRKCGSFSNTQYIKQKNSTVILFT